MVIQNEGKRMWRNEEVRSEEVKEGGKWSEEVSWWGRGEGHRMGR